MLKTWLTETLGISYPVIQGAMEGLARAPLAAAVSEAGGLGIIAAGTFLTAEDFREEIRKIRGLTNKPFAVNLTMVPRRREVTWEAYIYAALEEGVTIIETSGSSPAPYMEWLRAAGATVLHKASRLKDAAQAAAAGVSAVTVFGTEAGGHVGREEISSLVVIRQAVKTLDIPVIAAGGFADGRGLAAALSLGAHGIMMGTRFLVSRECPLHDSLKQLILDTGAEGTVLVEKTLGNAARVVRTAFAEEVLKAEAAGAGADELSELCSSARTQENYTKGDVDGGLVYCGQAAGLCRDIPAAGEIIKRIVAEASAASSQPSGAG